MAMDGIDSVTNIRSSGNMNWKHVLDHKEKVQFVPYPCGEICMVPFHNEYSPLAVSSLNINWLIRHNNQITAAEQYLTNIVAIQIIGGIIKNWPHEIYGCLLLIMLICQNTTMQEYGAWINMMTSSNGNIFRITGHLCWEFTGPRWIPHTKASDTELWCFLWSAPE